MSLQRGETDLHGEICTNLKPAFVLLLEGWVCAREMSSDPWDFAVSIRELRRQGITQTGLRWLVRKGYVATARELKPAGDMDQVLRPGETIAFCKRARFILTASGAVVASSLLENPSRALPKQSLNGHAVITSSPKWDRDARVLRLGERIVKRFKWRALNQEIVLSAFEEEHWPPTIYDPLPPLRDQDSKRRLQDTVKALNRNQDRSLLRFHTNQGEGVWWEILATPGNEG